MGQITFTSNLQRHVPCPSQPLCGATVREALDAVFVQHPRLRSYLLDEHGRLRRHVNIYVNEQSIADRIGLSDRVTADDDIFVFQALSGG